MATELINPCGEFMHQEVPLAPRVVLGPGSTVGLFHNSKMNAELLLEEVAGQLEKRYDGLNFVRAHKDASVPGDFSAGFLEECDVVIAALAD